MEPQRAVQQSPQERQRELTIGAQTAVATWPGGMAAASGAWQAMGHQQWPRRALLQNRDRPGFSSVNNLLVFTGALR
jgi:hypothetical protein